MKSSTTARFREAFKGLPADIMVVARKKYELWQRNPRHPSLHFKRVGAKLWSARITDNYRTLALFQNGTYYWIWIGTHSEYDKLLRK